jgi:hypothetical protein
VARVPGAGTTMTGVKQRLIDTTTPGSPGAAL